MEAASFLEEARRHGFDFYTGVPCSFLTPLIDQLSTNMSPVHVGASSEGEAVAIASGAWLAGRSPVVYCQNSGLGNSVNPLTSLNFPFRIPLLLMVTLRGQPGMSDEPQHELMGEITTALLNLMRINWCELPSSATELADALGSAKVQLRSSCLPFALLVKKDVFEGAQPSAAAQERQFAGEIVDLRTHESLVTRLSALERFLAIVPADAAVIVTTGKCGRELFTLCDRSQHLYQVGSMGCASAMALGVALNSPRPVVVLDGDGAALMKLGNLSTIGAHQPENLVHVILDNQSHDSTGGQATSSANVNFASVAAACGYAGAFSADTLTTFETALQSAFQKPGPTLIHLKVKPGSMSNLGRPTVAPFEVARRFREFLSEVPAS